MCSREFRLTGRPAICFVKLSPDQLGLRKNVSHERGQVVSQGDEITPQVLDVSVVFAAVLAVGPRLVITLGNSPTKALLDTKQPISKSGEFAQFDGITVMPTFNPAYLLCDPTKKREVWQDMKKVVEFLKGRER